MPHASTDGHADERRPRRGALAEYWNNWLARTACPAARLGAICRPVDGRSHRVADEVEAFQFELALEARRNPDVAPAARHVYRTYMSATEHALRSVGIAANEDLSRLVFAALDGLAFQQLLFEDVDATERARTELIALLRAAMDAPPSGPS